MSAVVHVLVGKQNGITIYPNPAREWAILKLPNQQPSTVSLFNSTGQQVYGQVHSGNSIRLSLFQLPRGAYQVVVHQDGERYAKQLYIK